MPQGTELECRWVTKPTFLSPCPPSICPHILAEHHVCWALWVLTGAGLAGAVMGAVYQVTIVAGAGAQGPCRGSVGEVLAWAWGRIEDREEVACCVLCKRK